MPLAVAGTIFGLFVVLYPEAELTAPRVFVSIALLNLLRLPLASVPDIVSKLLMVCPIGERERERLMLSA